MNLHKIKIKKSVLTIAMLFLTVINVFAADAAPDFLRSIGKMYVVVAVIVTMFLGLVAFMIYMERRISQLEQQIDD